MKELPFIQLFRTPIGYYFYDANKSSILSISKESYQELYEYMNGDINDLNNTTEELQELINEGYISNTSVIKTVEHGYTKYLEDFLDRKMMKITLQVTQNCNFRCKYCIYSEQHNGQQRKHSQKHMTWEVARDAIDFLRTHSIDSEEINVGFYGGEPLLEFELVKKVVKYCEELFIGKKLSFDITSNATLFDEEKIEYFIEHNIRLMISLDGPKEINDQNRVFADGRGTYDAVIEKYQLIKKISPAYAKTVHFSMVINPENDYDCINTIFINSENFEGYNIQAAIVDKDYDQEQVNFSEDYSYKSEYQTFLAYLAYYECYPKKKVTPLAQQSLVALLDNQEKYESLSPLQEIDAPSGPCVPGQMRLFSDVEGNLFPCERVSETSQAMKIGDIYNGINLQKANDLLNVGAISAERCKKCWCFRVCTLCAKKADDGEKLSDLKKSSYCSNVRSIVYNNFYEMLLLKEIPIVYAEQIEKNRIGGDFL